MMSSDPSYTVIILSQHGNEFRVDFPSKNEKWAFIQQYCPDIAELITNFTEVFGGEQKKIGFPHFMLKREFLKSIPVTTIDRQGNPIEI
ncbi:hypothetical protein EI16_12270 [Hydrogenovibrio marinus]|uniref:Uncharacterized protein n=2 Tax=Hydrogenovibrio marinus TaxID=28885 RepID=A0A066ZMG7_HYDMR|nr:hypothetical protein EI16_12270 [Hydrogenovibrio marinus]